MFRLLVDTIEDYCMCAMDPDGRIVHWNVGAVRTFGYTADEVLGRKLEMLFTPEDKASCVPAEELRIGVRQARSSGVGKGSEFQVRLPLVSGEQTIKGRKPE